MRIDAPREKLWEALWPLGAEWGWSGEFLSAEPVEGSSDRVKVQLSWEGRDGRPIEKQLRLSDVVPGHGFTTRVEDDSSLDPVFWTDYREDVSIEDDGEG